MPVMFASWRGVPTPLDQKALVVAATPGTEIVSAMRRPFGFTVIEVAQETVGDCPACGEPKTKLYAGLCETCQAKGG